MSRWKTIACILVLALFVAAGITFVLWKNGDGIRKTDAASEHKSDTEELLEQSAGIASESSAGEGSATTEKAIDVSSDQASRLAAADEDAGSVDEGADGRSSEETAADGNDMQVQQETEGKTPAVSRHIVSAEELEGILAGSPKETSFSASDVLWYGGRAAVDAGSSTVYLPYAGGDEAELGTLPDVYKEAFGAFVEGLSSPLGDGEIYFLEDERMADLQGAVRSGYPFQAYLVSAQGNARFQVVLTGLPAVCIEKTDEEKVLLKEDHFGAATFIDRTAAAGTTQKAPSPQSNEARPDVSISSTWNCKFHVRGNFSATLEKKPWKLTLLKKNGKKAKASVFGLRKDDDWILNPLYSDSSRVREMTAYRLWDDVTALSDNPCPSCRMRYVELFFDDSYEGIYGIMEPVDAKQLHLSEGDLLYKINRWDKDYPYLERYGECEGEMEIQDDSGKTCIEIRYPKEPEDGATWEPMEVYHDFTIRSKDEDVFLQDGLAVDLDSVITLSLYCTLTQAADNTWKNTLLVAKRNHTGQGVLRTERETPPGNVNEENGVRYTLYRDIWDLNYVFGDCYVNDRNAKYTTFSSAAVSGYQSFRDSTYDLEAFQKADSTVRQRVAEKWRSWREHGINAEHICGIAESSLEELVQSGAAGREEARWPQEKSFSDSTEEIKKWVRSRFVYLDDYYKYGQP